ncbi:hypothetical protein [Paraburkholderia sp. BR13444]|uniref:hypothetical protein n=1 Tax=Paraburkholderia sp. BR13444 TaxID=3236997 RepID=UPI0034CDAEB6
MNGLSGRRPPERICPGAINALHESAAYIPVSYRLLAQMAHMILMVACLVSKVTIRNRGIAVRSRGGDFVRKSPNDKCGSQILLRQLAGGDYVVRVDVISTEEISKVM